MQITLEEINKDMQESLFIFDQVDNAEERMYEIEAEYMSERAFAGDAWPGAMQDVNNIRYYFKSLVKALEAMYE